MAGLLDSKPTGDDPSPVGQVSARLQCVVSGGTATNLAENAKVEETNAYMSGFIGDVITPDISPNSDMYKALLEVSPVSHVAAGAPPFLLIHAEQDQEMPIKNAEAFQQALEKVGTPVKLIRVPNSNHQRTWGQKENAAVWASPMVQWMDQYLKRKATTTSTR